MAGLGTDFPEADGLSLKDFRLWNLEHLSAFLSIFQQFLAGRGWDGCVGCAAAWPSYCSALLLTPSFVRKI